MVTLKKDIVKEKEALIENARTTLKGEFVGIDNEIDGLINNIKPWFLFPELQESPCVINIVGLTGTGKTSVVKRIVQLLGIEEDFVYFNFASITEMSVWDVENTIEEELSNENPKRVFVYDEFQYAATINEHGEEKENKSALKPFWELLDSGIIHKRYRCYPVSILQNIVNTMEYINKKCKIVLEHGVWINAEECLCGREDYEIKRFHTLFNFGNGYEHCCFINEGCMCAVKELYEKKYNDIEGYYRLYDMDYEELHNELTKILVETRKGYDLNFSQSIIFVIANLDEAYEMAFDNDPDMSPDQFHKASMKINIVDIKTALKKRFRVEQIARLGNIFMIYPSFNKEAFEKIIDLHLNKYKEKVKELTGLDIEYKKSLKDFIYNESVYPTQGTRPIFSSIHEIVKSKLPNIIEYINENDLICDKFVLSHKDKTTIVTFYVKDKIVGKKTFKEVIRLQNLRESTKDDKQALVAVHESGHFIVYSMLNGKIPVNICVKTVNKENKGFVQTDVNENDSYKGLISNLKVAVAGYVAEKIVFGKKMMTCGASSDLIKATKIASSIIRNFGMDDYCSVRTYQNSGPINGEGLLTLDDESSTKTINNKVEIMIRDAMDEVATMLTNKSIKNAFCESIRYLSEHSSMSQQIMTEIYDKIAEDVRKSCQVNVDYKKLIENFINK